MSRDDWARDVRGRLSSLRLSPTRELEIVEELSQHLDDRWHELIDGGASSDEAKRLTLAEAAHQLRTKRLSPVEVTEACLARIQRLNPTLNAFAMHSPG